MQFFTGHDPEADVDYLLAVHDDDVALMVRKRADMTPGALAWSSPVPLAAVEVTP